MRKHISLVLMASAARQRGFMAIVLVVFLVVFVAIAAAIVSMTTSGTRSAADHAQASQALFAAESGFEWAAGELLGTGSAGCAAMEGASQNIGNGAIFILSNAQLVGGSCQLESRGEFGGTARVLTGNIPKNVLDGDSGGTDSFDDAEDEFNCAGPNDPGNNDVVCEEDGIVFEKKNDNKSETNTTGSSVGLYSGSFSADDDFIYLAANLEFNEFIGLGDSVFEFSITKKQGGTAVNCSLDFSDFSVSSSNSSCTGGPVPSELSEFDIVFRFPGFDPENTNKIFMTINWGTGGVDRIKFVDGCIGLPSHCSSTSDPVDDGTWDENP